MAGRTVTLPGGCGGETQARFRPLTGEIEERILDSEIWENPPRAVTRILARALEALAGKPPTEEAVADLCVADRQFLMLRLAALLDGETVWLTARCGKCGEPFDFSLDRSTLPVKGGGPGFPGTDVRVGGKRVDLRVPTGRDQEAIAGLGFAAALTELVRRCVIRVDGEAPNPEFFSGLTPRDVATMEGALDTASPAVATRLLARCPVCGFDQTVSLDPYTLPRGGGDGLLEEIHTLALHYHWSEGEILSLPRERRKRYLRLIDRSRGIHA